RARHRSRSPCRQPCTRRARVGRRSLSRRSRLRRRVRLRPGRVAHEMRDTDDLLDRQDEGNAAAGVVELAGLDDRGEDRVDLRRPRDGQHDLLLRLDRHAENLLLLVDAGATPVQHGAAARARLDRRLEDRAAPPLPNDADDERCLHVYDSLTSCRPRLTTSPRKTSDSTGARAISATSPSACTLSSSCPIAIATPKPTASRKVLASGPVATPPTSMAIARNPRSLHHMAKTTSR